MTVIYYDVGDTVTYMSRDCEPFISEKVGVIFDYGIGGSLIKWNL